MKHLFYLLSIVILLFGCSGAARDAGGAGSSEDSLYESVANSIELEGAATFTGTGFNTSNIPFDPPGTPGLAYDDTINPMSSESPPSQYNEQAGAGFDSFQERKLIKRAELNIEADQSLLNDEGRLSGANQKVDELMRKYRAYSERTWTDENSARFTIRVPQVYYESLIAETGILGTIRSRSETAEDVTLQFYDLEGRLTTRRTLLTTFQGYISRAQDIDDIMKIETRIADLQNEIDRLGSQFTRLSNQIDYATVELSIYTTRRISGYTLGDRIGQLFGSFGGFASGALLLLLGIVIYAVPILIFCLFAFWLLFGKVGILRKAFRFAFYNNNEKTQKLPDQTLYDTINSVKTDQEEEKS